MASPQRFIVSIHATLMVEVLLQMNWEKKQKKKTTKKQTGSHVVVGRKTKPRAHFELQIGKTITEFTCTFNLGGGEKKG